MERTAAFPDRRELEAFFREGYLRFPALLPAALLERLRTMFRLLMFEDACEADKAICETGGRRFVLSIDNLSNKGDLSGLELLGYPPILEIADSICGPDFFSLQEFAVIKERGSDATVLWHQDMLNERTGNCFTLGTYLDDSDEGDGAIRFVPGSHTSGRGICELQREPFIELPMKAGDVQIHDMMLAHSSESLRKREIRRVIYFEFLSARQVLSEGIYPEEYVWRRTELLRTAISYYRSLHPGEPRFKASDGRYEDLDPVDDFRAKLAEVYSVQTKPRASAYCFEGLEKDGTSI